MRRFSKTLAYRYTDKNNKFAAEIDLELLPIIIHGTEEEILQFIDHCTEEMTNFKSSISVIAYLKERNKDASFNVIKSLFASGVDPNNHFYSYTAIHQLYDMGVLGEYIDLLCEYKANLNIIDDNGSTVIGRAVGRSDIDSIQMLIGKGASVLIQDNYGSTALAGLKWDIADSMDYDEIISLQITKKK